MYCLRLKLNMMPSWCFIYLQETFARAKTWVKELQRQASPSIVIALAGNKSDLSAKRMVDHDEAFTYAEENGLLFMETSAKTAMNVTDIFLAIGKHNSESKNVVSVDVK